MPCADLLVDPNNAVLCLARRAISGQPNYSSWSPDGRALLVHIGGARPEAFVGTYDLSAAATQKIEVQWIQGIGSEKAAAPQARLMATVINGILARRLPWRLVLLGVFLVLVVELLGIRSLPFAVGSYLSIATTATIFAGGVVGGMSQPEEMTKPGRPRPAVTENV